jgi:hypothetical protein
MRWCRRSYAKKHAERERHLVLTLPLDKQKVANLTETGPHADLMTQPSWPGIWRLPVPGAALESRAR